MKTAQFNTFKNCIQKISIRINRIHLSWSKFFNFAHKKLQVAFSFMTVSTVERF